MMFLVPCWLFFFIGNFFVIYPLWFFFIFILRFEYSILTTTITTPLIIDWPISRPLQIATKLILSGNDSNEACDSCIRNYNMFKKLLI